jgi:hypothetical protein
MTQSVFVSTVFGGGGVTTFVVMYTTPPSLPYSDAGEESYESPSEPQGGPAGGAPRGGNPSQGPSSTSGNNGAGNPSVPVNYVSFNVPTPNSVLAAHTVASNSSSVVGASALTFGMTAGAQSATPQSAPAIVAPQGSTTDGSASALPGNHAPGAAMVDTARAGIYSESTGGESISPALEQPATPLLQADAARGYVGPARFEGDQRDSGGSDADFTTPSLVTRESLLAGIATNVDAVDRALQAALEEIENMGGELVTWFDDSNTTTWVAGATMLLAAGGGYYWQRRRLNGQATPHQDEPTSWLLNHLCHPAGRI